MFVIQKANLMLYYLLFQQQNDKGLDIELFLEHLYLPEKRFYNIEVNNNYNINETKQATDEKINKIIMDEYTTNNISLFHNEKYKQKWKWMNYL